MRWQLTFLLFVFYTAEVLALGQTGHRITGKIAEQHLTDKTKKALFQILGNESLAEASTYVDEMRSAPDEFWQKTASSYHYVTIPDGKSYHDVGAPTKGDAVFALKKYSQIVQDPLASKQNKILAIKFIVHLIGDLHQPFHVGNGTDRGGNEVKINFFGRDSNLHYIWDTGMLSRSQLSYSEWSEWLSKQITDKDVKQWSNVDPEVWIKESQSIRQKVYPETDSVEYEYLYNNLPILKIRLKQAGIRMAAYLNGLFEEKH
jgi:hypothetical protein